ncbi:alpha/beta hydrolase [Vibrio sp. Of14-4]|uniref:alpha/beta hydrolase n=1 Tax=Vibrio sp. Of14-4 TaxID=2724878 RepID=UPI001EF20503|nr:alpha/beta hydrolase [Vibrio sp. Of14-4]MCG7491636.1 alpha/beta hydrolase [Vibrio sp. Of14-4]
MTKTHLTSVAQYFTRELADEQYNPTLWTKRLPTEELLPKHIEFTTQNSDRYRARVGSGLSQINYGEGEFLGTMDVYRTEGISEDAPIVVYIHGGWWQWFSKEQFGFIAEPFNQQGFSVYMPGYRMATDWANDAPMESILKQMQFAVAEVLSFAAKNRVPAVYLVGHSAGGQLVSMLHKTDWSKLGVTQEARQKLKDVFSIAGLFDIRPLVNSFVNDSIKMTKESSEEVSPLLSDFPPSQTLSHLHLIIPEFDTPEFFRQTKEYHAAVLNNQQECSIFLASKCDHLDVIENLLDSSNEVLEYMLEHMNILR